MPPPKGIHLARHLPCPVSRSPAREYADHAADDPVPPDDDPPGRRRGEDRRPLLWLWVKEANKLSAFNRRSRGEGL